MQNGKKQGRGGKCSAVWCGVVYMPTASELFSDVATVFIYESFYKETLKLP
jgi:hypothetical protein